LNFPGRTKYYKNSSNFPGISKYYRTGRIFRDKKTPQKMLRMQYWQKQLQLSRSIFAAVHCHFCCHTIKKQLLRKKLILVVPKYLVKY